MKDKITGIFLIKRIINLSLIPIIIILFYSCASSVEEEVTINTYYTINYLLKAKQFLIFIIFVLDSGKGYWENIYSRLYYFYFTLARIKSILQKKKLLDNNHKEIWNLSKVEPRKVFGVDFKRVRKESDYIIIDDESKFINESNGKIIKEHKSAFIILINDIKDNCKKNLYEKDTKVVNGLLEEISIKYDEIIDKIEKYKHK